MLHFAGILIFLPVTPVGNQGDSSDQQRSNKLNYPSHVCYLNHQSMQNPLVSFTATEDFISADLRNNHILLSAQKVYNTCKILTQRVSDKVGESAGKFRNNYPIL
jgi:hypothetical protein